ncbi:MAG: ROK family protein [Lachnospiraceae bacterium]|nr:ROK family protein [Lachnospiraceae bacterium]
MYIGVDVGGTNLVVGIVNGEGDIIAKAKCPTDTIKPPKAVIGDILRLAAEACEKAGVNKAEIKSFGFGTPGTIDFEKGAVINSPNIPLMNNFPLRDTIQAEWAIPVYLVNDANAAAFGEAFAGSAKGCESMVMVTLGTGIGSGIVLNGKLMMGFNHIGAEIGHTVVVLDGWECNCGRKGCWEKYASASGLIALTREKMEANPDSKLWEIAPTLEAVDGKTAFAAAAQGCSAGKAVVELYLDYLACGVGNLVNIFQPQVLCIGGGISNEGDALLLPLIARVEKGSFRHPKNNTEIRIASLGNDAGIIGAALAEV